MRQVEIRTLCRGVAIAHDGLLVRGIKLDAPADVIFSTPEGQIVCRGTGRVRGISPQEAYLDCLEMALVGTSVRPESYGKDTPFEVAFVVLEGDLRGLTVFCAQIRAADPRGGFWVKLQNGFEMWL